MFPFVVIVVIVVVVITIVVIIVITIVITVVIIASVAILCACFVSTFIKSAFRIRICAFVFAGFGTARCLFGRNLSRVQVRRIVRREL